MEKFLGKIYYDPAHPASFGGLQKLYDASRDAGKKYSRKKVEQWMETQDTPTLYRRRRKKFPTRKTYAIAPNHHHQTDLGDFSKHAKHNDGHRFVLVVIDSFSRKTFARPLKNKSNATVIEGFREIYEHLGATTPLYLSSDRGVEFVGGRVQDYFREIGIKHFVLGGNTKAAIAERVLRTLKERIYKFMDSRGSERYVDELQNILHAYNESKHRSIGMAPNDVTLENASAVYKTLYGKKTKQKKQRFRAGNSVRISSYQKIFDKGYMQNYTDEIFTIDKVVPGDPTTFRLKDFRGEKIDGVFYDQELVRIRVKKDRRYRISYVVRTRVRNGKKQHLVAFRGYEKHPEWITGNVEDL